VVAALGLLAAGFAFSRQFAAAPAVPSTELPPGRSSQAPEPQAAPAPSPPAEATAPTPDAPQRDAARDSATEDCDEEPPPTSFTLAECDSGAEAPAESPPAAPASP
jgi:hypothetical protein